MVLIVQLSILKFVISNIINSIIPIDPTIKIFSYGMECNKQFTGYRLQVLLNIKYNQVILI